MGSSFKIRLANNLAYNFISELSRDIGLKLAGLLGVFPGFGKVTMVASPMGQNHLS